MNFRDRYYIFDQPVPYKNLLIYPVKLKDYYDFSIASTCLLLEKNSIKDPVLAVKAISMTYMEYMFSISTKEENYLQLFVILLGLVLDKKDDKDFEVRFNWTEKRPFFEIENERYDSSDFDQLRQIIAEQNKLSLPNEKIQKNVREKMEESRRYIQKRNKTKSATFEEQLMALSLYSGITLENIYNLTIRKFIMAIQRANHMIMSNIYLTASMSGFVTFKDKSILKGWLADLNEEDEYSDVKMSLESVQNKIAGNENK